MTLPSITLIRKLQMKKVREEERLYVLEGAAAVRDALLSGAEVLAVFHDARIAGRDSDLHALDAARNLGIEIRTVDESEMHRISGLQTTPPVLAIIRMPAECQPLLDPAEPLILALDRVSDPGNVGTLLRAAAFYGVREIWLGEGTADPFNPKTLRAAMASHLHLRVSRGVDLLTALVDARSLGRRILATVIEDALPPIPFSADPRPAILLLGNEPAGVSPELISLADQRVAIARRGPIDSLNVAMAGAILLDRLLAR